MVVSEGYDELLEASFSLEKVDGREGGREGEKKKGKEGGSECRKGGKLERMKGGGRKERNGR